jgi:hypothetical protein
MVSCETNVEDGQFVADRWVTELTKDKITMKGYRLAGAELPFVHVEGTMKRIDKAPSITPLTEVQAFLPVSEHMTTLNRVAGVYRLEGKVLPGPGADMMEIKATETYTPVVGGTILEGTTKGDEHPVFGGYEAWSAMGWSERKNCYIVVYVTSMGEIGTMESVWVDGKMVFTHVGLREGEPYAARGILEVDGKGKVTKYVATNIVGTKDPMVAFQATYQLQK